MVTWDGNCRPMWGGGGGGGGGGGDDLGTRLDSFSCKHIITGSCCCCYRTLFASSVLNLCELVSLRPDLSHLPKVLKFHENQLVYQ